MILSIIIPAYYVEKYIEKCIISTQNQDIDPKDYEVIIVIDGSPDRSLEIAHNVAVDYSNIIIVTRPNGGLSAARNTGMAVAKGDYYFFLDSDDWIEENCLGKVIQKLKCESPDVLCICAANAWDSHIEKRHSYIDLSPKKGVDILQWNITPCAPFHIMKADFLKTNKFLFMEGIYHEDSELIPRVLYTARKVSFLNDIVYYVYQNPNSITRTHNSQRAFDLIEHVCTSLSHFSCSVDKQYRQIFDNMISMYINNSLAILCNSSKEVQQRFNKCLYKNKKLLCHLRRSSIMKYRLEGMIMSILSTFYIEVYKVIKRAGR